jgi:hypothetical protein
MEVFGLRHDFLHIGTEHPHPVGHPKHPNSPQQGIGSFCSPIDQRQLHLWSDDRNDQTWNPGPATQVDTRCGRLGESVGKCCGVGNDFGKGGATQGPNTLGVAQHLQ